MLSIVLQFFFIGPKYTKVDFVYCKSKNILWMKLLFMDDTDTRLFEETEN